MKSRMVLLKSPGKWFALLITAFLFPLSINATNNPLRIVDGDNSDGGPPTGVALPIALDGCDFTYGVSVHLANLVLDTDQKVVSLPNNAPDIYLKVQSGNSSQILPVNLSNSIFNQEINGILVYTVPLAYVLDASYECFPHLNEHGEVEEPLLEISVNYTLVTYSGAPYPVADYAQPNDVFSCLAFTDTAPVCGNPANGSAQQRSLDQPGDPNAGEGTRRLKLECCTCNENVPCDVHIPHDDDKNRKSGNSSELIGGTKADYNICPNPFNQGFNFSAHSISQSFDFQVFNTNGKLIYQSEKISGEGDYQTYLDTQNWTNGLYYVKVNTSQQSETLRIVKIN